MKKLALAIALTASLLAPAGAQGAVGTLYDVNATWGDTNLPPGGKGQFVVQVRNVGDAHGAGDLTIEERLPEGVSATALFWNANIIGDLAAEDCSTLEAGRRVRCVLPGEEPGCSAEDAEKRRCRDVASLALAYEGKRKVSVATVSTLGSAAEPHGYLPPLIIDVAVDGEAAGTGTSTATVSGGGAPGVATDVDQVPFSANPSPFGILAPSFVADAFDAAYPFGSPVRKAGARPFELRTDFELNQKSAVAPLDGTRYIAANATIKTFEAVLPKGWIGNPEATPKCDPADFAEVDGTKNVKNATACPSDTQIGYLNVSLGFESNHGKAGFGAPDALVSHAPIYNLEPPRGVPADLAFQGAGYIQGHIYPNIDPANEYAIKALVPYIGAFGGFPRASEATFWGVPGDPAHDRFRFYPEAQEPEGSKEFPEEQIVAGAPFGSAPIRPFLTNPTDCGEENGGTTARAESYEEPGRFTAPLTYPEPLDVEGCEDERFRFEPDISLQPTSRAAGGPTGLDVSLQVPQRDDAAAEAADLYAPNGHVKGIPTPPIKRAVVTLPEGMTLSPSAAQGLASCSEEQIGLGSDRPVRCPQASQLGTLSLRTPILPIDDQPEGALYVAEQENNPFGTLLALYMVIEEPDRGVLVKIAGRVDLDPASGQITTTFDDLPQFPVADFQLSFKGGVRAALVNPPTCGTKQIHAELFSWHDPGTPKVVTDSFQVTAKPDGSPCPASLAERPFAPGLAAGTLNPTAAAFSPLALRVTRGDAEQELANLSLHLPQGLSGKLAGVRECTEAGIARAASRDGASDGRLELADPSCPASSLIGRTEVGAGVGVPLTYVPGSVYLAGPYRGAPLSAVVVSPAVVGPYDLGVIAVRSALHVDPDSAEVTLASDPFPQIFGGVPVRIRDVRAITDRPSFTLNPTSCAPTLIAARIGGLPAASASPATRFQAGDCASLPFKPKLHLRLFGGTRRGAHPKLRAVLQMPAGGANISRVAAALPRSEFLDQAHIRTVCTRVQFAAAACPKGAIYGRAVAFSPLLDRPLRGPIYLRSSDHLLPDLVLALRGRFDFNAVSRIDSVRGGIRNSFEFVPDVPVSKVVLVFQGGRKGLLVNSRNLCKRATPRARVPFRSHSNRRATLRPKLRVSCKKKRKRARRARHSRR